MKFEIIGMTMMISYGTNNTICHLLWPRIVGVKVLLLDGIVMTTSLILNRETSRYKHLYFTVGL